MALQERHRRDFRYCSQFELSTTVPGSRQESPALSMDSHYPNAGRRFKRSSGSVTLTQFQASHARFSLTPSVPNLPMRCRRRCTNLNHECRRFHPSEEACPPCKASVVMKKVCGHRYRYECHNVTSMTPFKTAQLFGTCTKCNTTNEQFDQNDPPSSEQFTQQQQQPQPQPAQNFGPAGIPQAVDRDKIYQWIIELSNSVTRENALLELSKKREVVLDLAGMLWYSFGTMASLLQEIVSIYPYINPATLTAQQSNRVCNALALLQCVASHAETRTMFLEAHIPLFLYPFLHTTSKTRPFEYLRLTSLGVIGALVKNDEVEVINFLLTTEIIPLCLRIMETGNELSKTVATFILQKILLDDSGLNYICQTYDRFSHVAMILGKMVLSLAKDPSARLLKHVVRCYLRLSDNSRAREALRQCLPDQLKDSTFSKCLKDDKSTKHWLSQLLKNVEASPPSSVQSNGPDLSRSTPNP